MDSLLPTVNLDEVDKDLITKHLVYGYIHGMQKILNIPDIIIFICLCFYYQREYFSIIDDMVEIQDILENKRKIIKKQSGWNSTAFGFVQIDSLSNHIYEWEIKLIKCHDFVIIGVASYTESKNNLFTEKQLEKDKEFRYAYSGYTGDKRQNIDSWIHYGNKYGQGDILKIILDLKVFTMSFCINNKSQGIAFKHIKHGLNIKYNLAVSLYSKNDTVELINFITY